MDGVSSQLAPLVSSLEDIWETKNGGQAMYKDEFKKFCYHEGEGDPTVVFHLERVLTLSFISGEFRGGKGGANSPCFGG